MNAKATNSLAHSASWLTPAETRVSRQLIVWADQYFSEKSKPASRYVQPPTTEMFTKHCKCSHRDVLKLLNRLERAGLLRKERRRSAGISGYGYDGSLYSSVLPTTEGRKLIAERLKV
jgi:hypothetical protein